MDTVGAPTGNPRAGTPVDSNGSRGSDLVGTNVGNDNASTCYDGATVTRGDTIIIVLVLYNFRGTFFYFF